MPAGQKWGLQCRFLQHWTNRWSERGGPSVWVLHRQLLSGVAPAVEHFLSQVEEGHRPLTGAQVVAPWGGLLLAELNVRAEFSQHRWAVHFWVERSWSMPLGKSPWICMILLAKQKWPWSRIQLGYVPWPSRSDEVFFQGVQQSGIWFDTFFRGQQETSRLIFHIHLNTFLPALQLWLLLDFQGGVPAMMRCKQAKVDPKFSLLICFYIGTSSKCL